MSKRVRNIDRSEIFYNDLRNFSKENCNESIVFRDDVIGRERVRGAKGDRLTERSGQISADHSEVDARYYDHEAKNKSYARLYRDDLLISCCCCC